MGGATVAGAAGLLVFGQQVSGIDIAQKNCVSEFYVRWLNEFSLVGIVIQFLSGSVAFKHRMQ